MVERTWVTNVVNALASDNKPNTTEVGSGIKSSSHQSHDCWFHMSDNYIYHPSLPLYLPSGSISKTRIKVREN